MGEKLVVSTDFYEYKKPILSPVISCADRNVVFYRQSWQQLELGIGPQAWGCPQPPQSVGLQPEMIQLRNANGGH